MGQPTRVQGLDQPSNIKLRLARGPSDRSVSRLTLMEGHEYPLEGLFRTIDIVTASES